LFRSLDWIDTSVLDPFIIITIIWLLNRFLIIFPQEGDTDGSTGPNVPRTQAECEEMILTLQTVLANKNQQIMDLNSAHDDLANENAELYQSNMELKRQVDAAALVTASSSKRSRLSPDVESEPVLLFEARAVLGLLFARCDLQGDTLTVSLPPLQSEFEGILKQPERALHPHWERLHATKKMGLQTDNLLATLVSTNFRILLPLLRKICMGQMFSEPFGTIETVEVLKDSWSLVHFAPPKHSAEWMAANAQALKESNDLSFNQADIHLVRKETALISPGPFDNDILSILGCISNFLVFADIAVGIRWCHHPNNPAVVNCFLQLAALFFTSKARYAIDSLRAKMPHLLFNIFGQFQDILSEFGKIITCSTSVIKLHQHEAIDYTLYRGSVILFKQTIKDMTNLIERSITNPYQMAMTSITTFYPPRPPKGDDGKGKGKSDGDDGKKKGGANDVPEQGNWISAKKGVRVAQTWTYNEFSFCFCHAFAELTCKKKACTYPHFKWDQIADNHKATLRVYVDANKDKFSLLK